MQTKIAKFLACPICRNSLIFEGKRAGGRFTSGYFRCGDGHLYQVKEEIGLFKDPKMSANEFEWKANVADEKRYDWIRRQYDSYLREDQRTVAERMLNELVALVAESCAESGSVLDVASGMGTFLLRLIEKCSGDSLVIGTDIDERPLRGMMIKAKKAGTYDRLSLIVTDAKHLSFRDNCFSAVSSFFGFDNVPQTVSALKESSRILRGGGRMFFTSLWLSENSKSMRLAEEHNVCRIASEDRLKNALKKAGLILEGVKEIYSGVWPHNPMDSLPVEGDEYSHVLVEAKKPAG